MFLCVSLCFSVFSFALNVSADSYDFYSINVLDYSYMDNGDDHVKTLDSSNNSFFYEFPFVTRCYQSEMLFKISGTQDIVSSVTVVDESNHSFSTDVVYVGMGYYRLLWSCGGYNVENLTFTVDFSTSSTTFQVLSFNISPVNALVFNPVYNAYVAVWEYDTYIDVRFEDVNLFSTIGTDVTGGESFRTDISFSDWKQYDYLDLCFSFDCATISSIMVQLENDISVPFEVREVYSNSSNVKSNVFTFFLHIDLTEVPRDGELSISLRGTCDQRVDYGGSFSVTCNSCCGYIKADSYSNPLYYWLSAIWTKLNIGFSNLGFAIQKLGQTFQTSISSLGETLVSTLDSFKTLMSEKFSTLFTRIDTFKTAVADNFSTLFTRITQFKTSVESKFDELISVINPDRADVDSSISDADQSISDIHDMEQEYAADLDSSVITGEVNKVENYGNALVFCGSVLSRTFTRLQGYQIIYILPICIGLFLFVASRVRGVDVPSQYDDPNEQLLDLGKSHALGKPEHSSLYQNVSKKGK